ncbi:MAG: serine hydrolase, partial [Planctomycetota bacterium]|nr:serine hydrolase [Planctomycetota bacterium]
IDHRLIRNGHLAVMTHQDQSLYLFLALAADRNGVSFYRKEKICDLLGLDFGAFEIARDRLVDLDLLSFKPYSALTVNGFYQLLPVDQQAPDFAATKPVLWLGMTSAVFESPDLVGADRVPWSHDARGRVASADEIRFTDPETLRPAGCMRCTINDWATFVLQHLRGEEGRSDYLSAETYRTLHTPPFGGKYALGWHVDQRDWAGGRFVAHTGSNLLNFSRVVVLLEKGYAVLVCTNQYCPEAAEDAAVVLIDMFSRGDLAVKAR